MKVVKWKKYITDILSVINKDVFINKLRENKKNIIVALIVVLGAIYSFGLGTIATKFTNISNFSFFSPNTNYSRVADESTMDSYKDMLINDTNGSRYAGRVWADKTVFAYGSESMSGNFNNNVLTLDNETDGVDKDTKIGINTDFLHVFSTLGSSQVVNKYDVKPVDFMLVLDISGSMGYNTETKKASTDDNVDTSRIGLTIDAINQTFSYLLEQNNSNRVGLTVFASDAYVLMPLDHYSSKDGKFITVSNLKPYSEIYSNFTLTANANTSDGQKYKKSASNSEIGVNTSLQAGIGAACKSMAQSDIYYYPNPKDKSNAIKRIPLLFNLSDGGTNGIAQSYKGSGTAWYAFGNFATTSSGPSNVSSNDSSGNQAAAVMDATLMSTALYKSLVEKHYQVEDADGLEVYNFYVDTENQPGYEQTMLSVTMNPEVYYKRDVDFNNGDEQATNYINGAIDAFNKWARTDEAVNLNEFNIGDSSNKFSGWPFAQLPNKDSDGMRYAMWPSDVKATGETIDTTYVEPGGIKLTKQDVIDNMNYLSSFNVYSVMSDKLDEVLQSAIIGFQDKIKTPIGGTNDSGVDDSLTYMDPIGKYLEIKQKSITVNGQVNDMALLLFGQMHGLVKTAVYDYSFNNTHRGENHNSSNPSESFIEGWYAKDGEWLGTSGDWTKGDVYYASAATTRSFVPTLPDENVLTNQQKNTVYTLYRFTDDTDTRNTPVKNKSYGDDSNVEYKLSDIRVWSEYTGNFKDEEGSGGALELGYDEALYINIPAEAMPIQRVDIEMSENDFSYKTNLGEAKYSTPLRVFYGVGVKDEVMTDDGLDIDVAKLDPDYVKNHTVKDGKDKGKLYFYSNYYSNTPYDGYETSGSASSNKRGDAHFTFSPNNDNRYYVYQRAHTLYEVNTTGNSKDSFDEDKGVYEEISIADDEALKTFEVGHDVVNTPEQVESEKWYYVILEYYTPSGLARVAVARKGAEFGSGIAGDNVQAGEYLSWYSPSRNKVLDYTTTKPTVSSGEKDDWVVATKPGGLRVGDMAQNVNYKSKKGHVTDTADTYYLPIVSGNSNSNDDIDDYIIINGYLGNNGKLFVSDSLLQVTKEVDSKGSEDTSDESFKFKLKVEGKVGDYSAIKLKQNPSTGKWQLRISTIDVLTDNQGLLQTPDFVPATITVDGLEYYVYIGDNEAEGDTGGDSVFRLYSSVDNDNDVTLTRGGRTIYIASDDEKTEKSENLEYVIDKEKAGTVEYWVGSGVRLIPATTDSSGNYIEWDGTFTNSISYTDNGGKFIISTLDSSLDPAEVGEAQISSNYATSTEYLREVLNFDDEYTAYFTLKDKEGLLLRGLDNGTDYTVSEEITPDQKKNGYHLDRVYDGDDKEYDVSTGEITGKIDASEEVHFVNKAANDLTVSKTVKGNYSDKTKDWRFQVKLTSDSSETIKKEYSYTKTKGTEISEGIITFVEKTDTTGTYYTYDFTLTDGEVITIHGIYDGVSYEVVEADANSEGYTTVVTGDGLTLETQDGKSGTFDDDKTVEFVNYNISYHDIKINKTVDGSDADSSKHWEFIVTLTNDDFELAESYPLEGCSDVDSNSELKLTETNGTYKGSVFVKAGETVTIKGLPEGTHYTVEEKDANKDGYKTSVEGLTDGTLGLKDAEGNISSDPTLKFVNIKNSYHDLVIEKEAVGRSISSSEEWKFTLTLEFLDNIMPSNKYHYIKTTVEGEEEGDLEVLNPEKGGEYSWTFNLKHKEKIKILNVQEGTTYTIVEEDADDYDVTINGEESDDAIKSGVLNYYDCNEEGNECKRDTYVKYVNTKLAYYDLSVTKTFGDSDENITNYDRNILWKFEMTLSNEKYSIGDVKKLITGGYDISIDDSDENVYKITFYLTAGDTFNIKNLVEDTKYEVKEVDANTKGFTITNSSYDGTLIQNESVEFKNEKLPVGSLKVQKTVDGSAGLRQGGVWNFILELTVSGTTLEKINAKKINANLVESNFDITLDPVEAKEDGTYTYKIEFSLSGGESLTLLDLPENTKYSVEEVEANKDGFFTTVTTGNDTGIIGEEDAIVVNFLNKKPEYYNLKLSKVVEGIDGKTESPWNFELAFEPDDYIKLPYIDEKQETVGFLYDGTVNGESVENVPMEVKYDENSKKYIATVTLYHNDTIEIKGIPEKTKYEIKEIDSDGHTVSVKDGNDLESTPTKLEQSEDGSWSLGTKELNDNDHVMFINTKLAKFNLNIKKTLDGNIKDSDKDIPWHFTISLLIADENADYVEYDYSINGGTKEKLGFERKNGKYETVVSLKGGEVATIYGLIEGTEYTVSEEEFNEGDYVTVYPSNVYGELDKSQNTLEPEVEVVNWKVTKHNLTIEKQLKGNNTDSNRKWTMLVAIKPSDNLPKEYEFGTTYKYTNSNGEEDSLEFTSNNDGTYTSQVSIKGFEKVTIEGLPYNTEYKVEEIEANKDNYQTTYIDEEGILTNDEHNVVVVNERNIIPKIGKISSSDIISNPYTADGILKYFFMLIVATIGSFTIVIREYILKK